MTLKTDMLAAQALNVLASNRSGDISCDRLPLGQGQQARGFRLYEFEC